MMRRIRALVINDTKQIFKDPMLMASLLGPLAIIAFARFIFLPLSDWIEQRYGFRLSDYTHFTVTFLLLIVPMLPGTMAGLLMLDERDENIIAYYAVTPLAREGYFRYRLMLPSFLSVLLTALFLLLSGLAMFQIENGFMLILLALEAPCIALFLVAFAANKVEGLALSKVTGLLFAGPIIAFFVPESWQYLGMLVPTYWPAKCYLAGISNEPFTALGAFVIGLIYHVLLLKMLVRSFMKRVD
jgi:fluoroquinolone transport system permease protein